MKRVFITLTLLFFSLCAVAQWEVLSQSFMNEYRENHQVATGGDGVLAAGGWDGSQITGSAEIFDVNSEEWTPVASMETPRTTFAMCDLNNGYVIAAGGWDGNSGPSLASTEIYDAELDEWMAGPDLTEGRSFPRSTKLSDGRILFTGGFNGSDNVATADIYDPVSNTISPASPMNYARSSHTAVLLEDGRVLVAGGFNPDLGFQMDECEIYDPFLDTWTEIASLSTPRDNHASISNPSGFGDNSFVMVSGGRTFNGGLNLFEGIANAEIYDIANDSWTTVSTLHPHSYNHLAMGTYGVFILAPPAVNQTGEGVTTTYSPPFQFSATSEESTALDNIDETPYDNRYLSAGASFGGSFFILCGGDPDEVGSSTLFKAYDLEVSERELDRWSLFPNPAIDNMYISGQQSGGWELFDQNGMLLRSGEQNIVPVSDLAAGTYILHITQGDRTESHTFQKVQR